MASEPRYSILRSIDHERQCALRYTTPNLYFNGNTLKELFYYL